MIKYFPAIVSGGLLTLAFPNTCFYLLAFVALIPLMVSVVTMSEKDSFYAGTFAGFTHYLSLMYWIVPTLNRYGGLHLLLSLSALVLLSFYLALYLGGFAFFYKRLKVNRILTPVLAAALWVGLEYVRTYLLTGLPWGALGYSQYLNLDFIQVADFSGVYGVSFLIVLLNAYLSMVWIFFTRKRKEQDAPYAKRHILIGFVVTTFFVAFFYFYGVSKRNRIASTIQNSPKVSIAVVQGNIKQDRKWDKAFKIHTIEKYASLSNDALSSKPELIIWPETALPFYYDFDMDYSRKVDTHVRKANTNFLVGSPAVESREGEKDYDIYNRVYMLNRFAIITSTYDKVHLVPFGEYVPFGKYLKFLGKLTAQVGDFSPGKGRFKPLVFNKHSTGVLICFEILFPSISSAFVKNGATILTTVTNDAWFGRTSAPLHHFSISVFRAIENRRTVVRAANTGISGFIDPEGKILKTTSLFEDTFISQSIPVLKSLTFYTSHGDLFAIICIVAICLTFVVEKLKKKMLRRNQK
ncbi:MAG: apolipoprotein N-acyltransferase [Desulfobacteraceae bacterium]|nr:apolipoprotein N-acyltransferase [Desulfobacteraceae bacterium]